MELFSRVVKVRNSYRVGVLIVLSFLFFGRVAGAEVISGTLFETDGVTKILGVDLAVDVFQSSYDDPCQSQYIDGAGVDTANGTYSIDVTPGNYYLRITNFDTNYIEEYWAPGVSEIECQNAGMVTVVSGTPNTGKNFQLDIGGSVSGILYQDDGSTPMPNLDMGVSVFKWQNDEKCGWYEHVSGTNMNADASYLISGVAPGTYYLNTWSNGTAYIDEYWADPDSTKNCQDAQTITVASANDTVEDKDFQLELGGTVTGTIYHTDGTSPITNESLNVFIFQWSGGMVCEHPQNNRIDVPVEADGTYSISGIIPGDYYLEVSSGSSNYIGEFWADPDSVRDCQSSQFFEVTTGAPITNKDFQLELGGSISGTLYDSEGTNSLTDESLMINVWKTNSDNACDVDHVKGEQVNPDGTFTIRGVEPGDYYLRVQNEGSNYVEEYWADPSSMNNCNDAEVVTVSAGIDNDANDFQLDVGASISGVVYYSDGETPIINEMMGVEVFSGACEGSNWIGSAEVDQTDGSFLLAGLPAGDWYLRTNSQWSSVSTVDAWYAGAQSNQDCDQAIPVTVAAGGIETGKNFQLDIGGSVSGILYESDGSTPITGNTDLNINIRQGTDGCASNHVTGTMVNSDGTYLIEGILPGENYYLEIYASGGAYVEEYWADPLSVTDCQNAASVTVEENIETQSKNFQLDIGGSVTGTLFESDGTTPITGNNNLNINIGKGTDPCNNDYVKGTSVNSDGTYTIAGILPGNDYYLYIWSDGGDYVEEAWAYPLSLAGCQNSETISIVANQVTQDKNFQLDIGGSISGIVYHTDGTTPLTGESIKVRAYTGSDGCNRQWAKSVYTNAENGTYTLNGLAQGNFFIRAGDDPSSYTQEFWADPSSDSNCNNAGSIPVTSGVDTPNKNFQLDEGGSVSGIVYLADGVTPLVGVDMYINAFAGGSACNFDWVRGGELDTSNGTYSITGLASGTYYIRTGSRQSDYVSEFWADSDSVVDCGSAEDVTVSAGNNTPGKNFQLVEGGSISGTLFQTDGTTPLTGVSTRVRAYMGSNACLRSWIQSIDVDTATGSYRLRGIPAGNHFVKAGNDDSDYVTEFWASPLSDSACESAASIPVTVGAETSDKNFQMDLGFSISGTVFKTDGSTPLTAEGELEVALFKDSNCNGYSTWNRDGEVDDADGSFIIRGLENGTYYLKAEMFPELGTPYISEYYGNPASVRSCLQAGDIIINNASRNDINFQLDPGACTISGAIYKANGMAVEPVGEEDGGVVAYPNNPCSSSEWASAGGPEDSSGEYEIGGLEPGTYYLQTIMNWSSNPNEWWNDSGSTFDCNEAQVVDCISGTDATGRDFNLGLGLEHVILMNQIIIGQADVNRSIHLGMDKNNDGKIGLAEVVDAMRELAGM